MDSTTPVQILERQLKEIKHDRNRAKCRTGVLWNEKTFIECDKLIADYEKSISILNARL